MQHHEQDDQHSDRQQQGGLADRQQRDAPFPIEITDWASSEGVLQLAHSLVAGEELRRRRGGSRRPRAPARTPRPARRVQDGARGILDLDPHPRLEHEGRIDLSVPKTAAAVAGGSSAVRCLRRCNSSRTRCPPQVALSSSVCARRGPPIFAATNQAASSAAASLDHTPNTAQMAPAAPRAYGDQRHSP